MSPAPLMSAADVQAGWRWGLVEVGYRVLGCVRRLLGLGGFEAPAGFGLFRGELRRAVLAGFR